MTGPRHVLLDRIAVKLYGMTTAEALDQCICIRCKQPMVRDLAYADLQEYLLTALCHECFDVVTEEEEA